MLRESSGGWNSDGTTTSTDLDAFIAGDLGVGVSPASDKIHLKENNAAVRIEDDSGNYATIRIGNSQLVISVDPGNGVGSTDLVFELDGVEVGRFFVGGNFGLGISAPAAKLHVFNLSANPAIMERASSSTTSVLRCLELHRTVDGGVGADGIGASLAFRVEDDGGSIESAAVISGILVDAAAAGEQGALVFELASDSGLFEAGRIVAETGDIAKWGINTNDPNSTLDVQGGLTLKRTVITDTESPYTALVLDNIIGVDTTSGVVSINLPAAATAGNGLLYRIKDEGGNAGTNNITIDGNAAETIDGAATLVLSANFASAVIYSDGSNWYTL